jgi:hypothetical protein
MNVQDQTQSLSLEDPDFQAMVANLRDNDGTASLKGFSEVLLLMGGIVERLPIEEDQKYLLGRFQHTQRGQIDLKPYRAIQYGVSRVHAGLLMHNEQLSIVDLDSTNGTYIRHSRLKPNEPSLLRRGDELFLARMWIQIMFR